MAVAPAKLNFGKVDATVTSKTKKLTLNNKGDEPTTIGQLSAPASFIIVGDTCSNTTLASKKKCTVDVAFAPTSPVGSISEPLDIPFNGSSPSETLTGDGTAVSLSGPKSKTLPNTAAGSISKAENITLKNESGATVGVGSPSALTDFKIATDGCAGATLTPKDKCMVSVEFAPPADAGGTLTDTLSYSFAYGSNSGNVAVVLTGKVK